MFIKDPVYANVHHDCATHPKRMAIFMKVQMEIKSVNLSDKSKKIVGKKLKKACQTRWLSFHDATSALFHDYLAVLQTQ